MGATVQLESSHVFRCPLHEQKPWPNLSILAHGSYFTFDDSILFSPSQVWVLGVNSEAELHTSSGLPGMDLHHLHCSPASV
jgi:hypothetical protein